MPTMMPSTQTPRYRRGASKKPSAMVTEQIARLTMNQVSKAALLDFAADMIRRTHGDEHMDGAALAAAFVEEFEPVAIARGDKPPRVWQSRKRPPPVMAEFCPTHRRLRSVCACAAKEP